jgi:predicted GNAT family acetyltransferase
MEQMVCDAPPPVSEHASIIETLGADDVPEMVALAKLTEPGPFREGTIRLGGYRGIRENGRLVAMSGQRLSLTGFTEVSAVCTHPDFRGRGYANALVSAVAHGIYARGETPFLGVRQDNINAIRVYEKLGFRICATQYVTVVKRPL